MNPILTLMYHTLLVHCSLSKAKSFLGCSHWIFRGLVSIGMNILFLAPVTTCLLVSCLLVSCFLSMFIFGTCTYSLFVIHLQYLWQIIILLLLCNDLLQLKWMITYQLIISVHNNQLCCIPTLSSHYPFSKWAIFFIILPWKHSFVGITVLVIWT